MENKIKKIISLKKELSNCNDMIFEKENDILSCVKSIGEEGIRNRQKEAAVSLLELKEQKASIEKEIKELCKAIDEVSFNKKKLSSSLISKCISEGISRDDLVSLKEAFKNN